MTFGTDACADCGGHLRLSARTSPGNWSMGTDATAGEPSLIHKLLISFHAALEPNRNRSECKRGPAGYFHKALPSQPALDGVNWCNLTGCWRSRRRGMVFFRRKLLRLVSAPSVQAGYVP